MSPALHSSWAVSPATPCSPHPPLLSAAQSTSPWGPTTSRSWREHSRVKIIFHVGGPQRLAGGSTGSNRLGSPPGNMQPLLLLVALLLPPGARAGEIIGGQEARPHSRPYMAYMHFQSAQGQKTCGGFLVRKDFVMTAAHCFGRQTVVILGAHNIRRFERTQQRISVLRAIPHPRYNPYNHLNDIMLLQLANRTRQNRFVRPVALPRTQARLSPGARCTVAGWGLVSLSRRTDTLQEVQLTVQRDGECHRRFDHYNGRIQMCVGDPRERKSAFLVRPRASTNFPETEGPDRRGSTHRPHLHCLSLGPGPE